MAKWLTIRMRVLKLALTLVTALLLVCPLSSVLAESERITVGWSPVPGLMQETADGHLTGFMIELARALATEAGLTLDLVRYETVPELLEAQAKGRTDLLAGIADLPSLRGPSHYSAPVGRTLVSLFMRRDRAPQIDPATEFGLRFGAIRGASGSELVGVLLRHEVVTFTKLSDLFQALEAGEVDGYAGPRDAFVKGAEAFDLADRYTEISPPVQILPRVVALHRSRTELRSRIDSAVLRLGNNGTLDRLRTRWGVEPPESNPSLLVVGLSHEPPFVVHGDDGRLTGFSVEVMRDLAERAGLHIRFKEMLPREIRKGPGKERFDLLSLTAISGDRTGAMDFGLPILTAPYSVFALSDEAEALPGNDWSGVRLGVLSTDMSFARNEALEGAEAVPFASATGLIFALLTGHVDAALHERHRMVSELTERGFEGRIVEVGPEIFDVEHAVGFRFGLAPQIAQMNAVIPGYLASSRYLDLRLSWFPPPSNWVSALLPNLLGAVGAAFVIAMGGLVWHRYQRRLHEARRDIAEDLIDKIPLGIVLLGRDGRIKYVNKATASTAAASSGRLVEGNFYENALRGLVADGRADLGDTPLEDWIDSQMQEIWTDGFTREIHVDCGITFLRTTKLLKGGESLLLRHDVTEERARMRQIQMLNEDLQEQIRLAEATTEDLRAFAYATSHDLKSPTNTALMIADALREELGDAPGADCTELLTDLRGALGRMSSLIDDVQSYTNAIAPTVAQDDVDLSEAAREVIADLADAVSNSGATVTVNTLGKVPGSPGQLRILLATLIDNAIKFHARGSVPVISVDRVNAPEGFVGLSVTDNGIGIDPAHLDRIFQLFQRLNSTVEYTGNGLGLAICQRIALNHGGRIFVASTPGVGSTFTVILRKETP
ncbi:transporter substrate-binding domain-containing protein [Antarctobacter sp.]|uniref:transporter substrate-binding domain-containing protein n=1 Tax=Antarctobacter sp. TaxID=1872577 RepID=UPI003A8EE4A5